MKLRNKKTGEIIELLAKPSFVKRNDDYLQSELNSFNSLAELNEEWEDYEEPKDNNYWYIDDFGRIQFSSEVLDEIGEHPNNGMIRKLYGNYYLSREEAEKAVEKLKAIQRLKNYYLKFKLDFVKNKIEFTYRLDGTLHSSVDEQRIIFEDMNLLFGGEE